MGSPPAQKHLKVAPRREDGLLCWEIIPWINEIAKSTVSLGVNFPSSFISQEREICPRSVSPRQRPTQTHTS